MAWKQKLVDLAERTIATFAQSFVAVVLVDGGLSDLTAVKTGAVAGGLAVLKYAGNFASTWLKNNPEVSTPQSSQ